MKFRIYKHIETNNGETINFHYTVKYKKWGFWWTIKRVVGRRDYTHTMPVRYYSIQKCKWACEDIMEQYKKTQHKHNINLEETLELT